MKHILFEKFIKKNLASKNLGRQIWGAVWKIWWLLALLIVVLLTPHLLSHWHYCDDIVQEILHSHWYKLTCVSLVVLIAILVCLTLTNIFNLRKQENGITWCQISILIFMVLWIIGFLMIFDIKEDSRYYVAICIVGTLLGWIFQDKIKGAAAFVHLRLHHLLNIDDWIQVPSYNVDGEVKRVTLTTVTVYNWDTTTSTIPISALHSDHFINCQKMAEGKTYGRRMYMTYIVDTSYFHSLTTEEINYLKQDDVAGKYLPKEELKEGVLNAHLYRIYLFHWLMNNPHVSQQPRMIVRWLEHTDAGLPMQVYAYITDSELTAFEWQQSQITEHIIKSLGWFGLRLYQRPSGYDINDINIKKDGDD
ncbi:MAG: mechanosensitive ion channel [Bacteroidales bacterium]|nr:mechanosensitive ion channel [Bacteroidales bacterium]